MRADERLDPQTSQWHVDKRLNVAVIVALLAHAGSSLWWASSFSTRTETRLEAAERRLTLYEDLTRRLTETQATLATQIATQSATTQAIAALAAKLDARVDQLYRPSAPPAGGR